ncbi:MAG: isoprenylcysteine carboxylmethyltransferase family protein [Bacteroidales bacterium]|jgi:protein-S-isoprenylcysteine O-methyltransferase Ste14|nr:isoprenylcysteine carboxylmethyltransferase family protein [Bacteroidales bacterium]
MTDFLRVILPIYFVVYFSVAIVLKSVLVAKRTGKNPFVLPKDDSVYGVVGFYFKLVLIAIFMYAVVYAVFPAWHSYFLPIQSLENQTIQCVGISLLFLSLVWTVIAQTQMKNSWRIGIDTGTRTELITVGLFSISRNPIFFGMIVTLLGVFLATPNAVTLFVLMFAYVLIQIQIRLEEEFLTKEHGDTYLQYKQNVRRLI